MIQYAPIRIRPKRSSQAQREVRRNTPLRKARTCYGHLAGVAGVALLLAYEQSLVRPDDLSRVKQAFDLNGYVGLFYLTATAAAIYVG